MLRWDQGLPVLLLRDGEDRHADVVAFTRAQVATLAALGAPLLRLALAGGRGGGARGLCLRRPHPRRGPGRVVRAGEQAEAVEEGPPQVAGGVEAALPVGSQGQGVGGAAGARVGDGVGVRLVRQVGFREDLPAVVPHRRRTVVPRRPVGPEAGRSLQVTFNPLVSGSGMTSFRIAFLYTVHTSLRFPLRTAQMQY